MSAKFKNMNARRQDRWGRENLKCSSLSNGFVLSSSKEDSTNIGYRAILIVFASFLIDGC